MVMSVGYNPYYDNAQLTIVRESYYHAAFIFCSHPNRSHIYFTTLMKTFSVPKFVSVRGLHINVFTFIRSSVVVGVLRAEANFDHFGEISDRPLFTEPSNPELFSWTLDSD